MSREYKQYNRILDEKLNLRKVITKQRGEHRKTLRRLESLIRTAEKKNYAYRHELEIIHNWESKILTSLATKQIENNRKIKIGKALVEIGELSLILEYQEQQRRER